MNQEKNYLEINRQSWNNRVDAHLQSAFYDVAGFLNGKSSLNDIELEMLGDLNGKSLLHLQCHFGQDTISLARLGATATGVDLSDKAIEEAKNLAKQVNVEAKFLCCDVYDLPNHLTQQFDVVFTSYGTIGWLPSLDKWAKVISTFLKPGGKLVFVEFHPVVWMFDDDFKTVAYRYFNSRAHCGNRQPGDISNFTGTMAGLGDVAFIGPELQFVSGAIETDSAVLDNASGVFFIDSFKARHLNFITGNYHPLIQDIFTTGMSGYHPRSFVWTDGGGKLSAPVNANPVTFPVGSGSYLPLTLSNGKGVEFTVGAMDSFYLNPETRAMGHDSDVVDAIWSVRPHGVVKNVMTTVNWNASDEGRAFDRNYTYLATWERSLSTQWLTGEKTPASGNDPFAKAEALDYATTTYLSAGGQWLYETFRHPEIAITGRGHEIFNGQAPADTANGTNLGTVAIGNSFTSTFQIINEGTDTLFITDATITGTNASAFQIVGLPNDTLLAGDSTTLQVSFTPSGKGLQHATVRIMNNDSNEGNFEFEIGGLAEPAPYYSWMPLGPADTNQASYTRAEFTDIAIHPDGTPYVVYSSSNGGKATVKKFENGVWRTIGNEDFSAGIAYNTTIAINKNGVPYVAYKDYANGQGATVKKFNGSSWVTVGAAGFSAGVVNYPKLEMDGNGTPYVVYSDVSNGEKATVKKFDGNSWVPVGAAGFSTGKATHTSLAIDKSGTPYVAFRDNNIKATVMKYNGTNWVDVGNSGFSPGYINNLDLALDESGQPYVAFGDGNNSYKATVMKYNGSSWITVGNVGFTTNDVDQVCLSIDKQNSLLLAYRDRGVVKVLKYNGSSWVNVGTTDISNGSSVFLSMALDKGGISYLVFQDNANGNKATARRFNGTTWEVLGETGFSPSFASYSSVVVDGNGVPFVAFRDAEHGYKASVMKWNGNNWEYAGNAGFSSGYAANLSLTFDPNNQLYVAYRDGDKAWRATVQKLVDTTWNMVGGSGFTSGDAYELSMTLDRKGTPYVVYRDGSLGYKISVKKFNGSSWVYVGSSSFSTNVATYPAIAISPSDQIYVAYIDYYYNSGSGTQYKVICKKFSNGSWTQVGSVLSTNGAQYTAIAIDSNEVPYVMYADGNDFYAAVVKKYTGSSWQVVGSSGFSPSSASYNKLFFGNDNSLYASYGQQEVSKFDGTDWVLVGGTGYSLAVGNFEDAAVDEKGVTYAVYTFGGAWAYKYGETPTAMAVTGQGAPIENLQIVTSLGDSTHFGTTVPGAANNAGYWIFNTGSKTLFISDTSITGTDANQFSIISLSQDTIFAGDSALLQVRYQPFTKGEHNATVEITGNAENAPTFTFAISGEALEPFDHFTRADSNIIGSPSSQPGLAWHEIEKHNNSQVQVESGSLLLQNCTSNPGPGSGEQLAYIDVSSIYPTTFDADNELLEWHFNMRQDNANPSFQDNAGFVLGATDSSFYTTGQGYAVILGDSASSDSFRLIRFAGGLGGSQITIADTIVATDLDDYYSIRISYNPCSGVWTLQVRSDGDSAFAFPVSITAEAVTVTDQTYTSIDLPYIGTFLKHSSACGRSARFDNIFLPEVETMGRIYSWTGTEGTNYQDPENWNPVRNCPQPVDVLQFNTGSEHRIFNVPDETVAQINITHGTRASFFAQAGGATLNLLGENDTALVVEAGSRLIFDYDQPLTMFIGDSSNRALAVIEDSLIFDNSVSSSYVSHQLLSAHESSIFFKDGSVMLVQKSNDWPFGVFGKDSIAFFEDGATYYARSGGDPFGNDAWYKTAFADSSFFISESYAHYAFPGRRYGHFIQRGFSSSRQFGSTKEDSIVFQSLTVEPGITMGISTTSLPLHIVVKEHIIVDSNAILEISAQGASAASNLIMNGSKPQRIQSQNPFYIQDHITLLVDNEADVNIEAPITIEGGVYLDTGNLIMHEYDLLCRRNGSISGADSNSYISTQDTGLLIREYAGADSLLFPVGYNPYLPATIQCTNCTAGDAIGVRVQDSVNAQPDGGGSMLTTNVVTETWTVKPIVGSPDINIRLQWNATNQAPYPGLSNNQNYVGVGYNNSEATAWRKEPVSTAVNASAGVYSLTRSGISLDADSTYKFGVGGGNSPVPVELLDFTAQWLVPGKEALLKWATASEFNTSYFEVQRSFDLQSWKPVGTKAGRGNSAGIIAYQYVDPLEAQPEGLLYYRLRMVDLDGSYTYSPVRVLDYTGEATATIEVYPNPSESTFHIFITSVADEKASIHLNSATGSLIWESVVELKKGSQILTVTPDVPAGIYFLHVQYGDRNQVVKLVKEQ